MSLRDLVPSPVRSARKQLRAASIACAGHLTTLFARLSTELFTNVSLIHSEFIAPSFNAATKNDVAGFRNGGGAWESSPKVKEGTSKWSLSGETGELTLRTQLDGYSREILTGRPDM
jgi:hypothetical protein